MKPKIFVVPAAGVNYPHAAASGRADRMVRPEGETVPAVSYYLRGVRRGELVQFASKGDAMKALKAESKAESKKAPKAESKAESKKAPKAESKTTKKAPKSAPKSEA